MAWRRSRPAGAAASSRSACSTVCTAATPASSGTPSSSRAERGVPSVLMTFVPHPSEVVRPGTTRRCSPRSCGAPSWSSSSASTCSARCRSRWSSRSCRRTSSSTARSSSACTRRRSWSARTSGSGTRRPATSTLLARLGQRVRLHRRRASRCCATATATLSATYVRSCVQAGDVTAAADALGRPHRVDGVVERGDQRGRELGFPTANLRTERGPPCPPTGCTPAGWSGSTSGGARSTSRRSASRRSRSARTRPSRCGSAGSRPTSSTSTPTCTGRRWASSSSHRLRGMERFDVDALVTQMHADVEQTRAALS